MSNQKFAIANLKQVEKRFLLTKQTYAVAVLHFLPYIQHYTNMVCLFLLFPEGIYDHYPFPLPKLVIGMRPTFPSFKEYTTAYF